MERRDLSRRTLRTPVSRCERPRLLESGSARARASTGAQSALRRARRLKAPPLAEMRRLATDNPAVDQRLRQLEARLTHALAVVRKARAQQTPELLLRDRSGALGADPCELEPVRPLERSAGAARPTRRAEVVAVVPG